MALIRRPSISFGGTAADKLIKFAWERRMSPTLKEDLKEESKKLLKEYKNFEAFLPRELNSMTDAVSDL